MFVVSSILIISHRKFFKTCTNTSARCWEKKPMLRKKRCKKNACKLIFKWSCYGNCAQFNFGSIGAPFPKLHTHFKRKMSWKMYCVMWKLSLTPRTPISLDSPSSHLIVLLSPFTWDHIHWIIGKSYTKAWNIDILFSYLVALLHFGWIIYGSKHLNDIFKNVSIEYREWGHNRHLGLCSIRFYVENARFSYRFACKYAALINFLHFLAMLLLFSSRIWFACATQPFPLTKICIKQWQGTMLLPKG